MTTRMTSQKAANIEADGVVKKEAPAEIAKPKKTMKVKINPLARVYFRVPASSESFKLHWSVAISISKVQNEQPSKVIYALVFMMGPGLEFARMVA